MNKTIEVNEDELISLVKKLFALGEDMGKSPDEFAVMLSMVAKNLCEAQGIEVHSERRIDA